MYHHLHCIRRYALCRRISLQMTKLCFPIPTMLFTYFDQNIIFPYHSSSSMPHYIIFVLLSARHAAHCRIIAGSTYHNQSTGPRWTWRQTSTCPTLQSVPSRVCYCHQLICFFRPRNSPKRTVCHLQKCHSRTGSSCRSMSRIIHPPDSDHETVRINEIPALAAPQKQSLNMIVKNLTLFASLSPGEKL